MNNKPAALATHHAAASRHAAAFRHAAATTTALTALARLLAAAPLLAAALLLTACSGSNGRPDANTQTATTAPTIITPPQDVAVAAGTPATFLVVAGGSGPLTFQWSRNGASLPAPGSDSLTVEAPTLADDGAVYAVTVGNAAGTVTSAGARLTVAPGPGIELFAGTIGGEGNLDGTGAAARFAAPTGIAFDAAGNAWIADNHARGLRRVTPAGVVTTVAGTLDEGGTVDGPAATASFRYPAGLVFDRAGNLFITDNGDHVIRKMTPDGVFSTFAGTPGSFGNDDGTGAAARFGEPYGITIDAADMLYVTDRANHTIRRIAPDGTVTTFAGAPGEFGSVDDLGADARFCNPTGITIDGDGNLYVTDLCRNVIRRVNTAGAVATIAGSPGISGTADGNGSAASFISAAGIVFEAPDRLYVADTDGRTIRQVTTAGVVTTLAGSAETAGDRDGIGAAARFGGPMGIGRDATGNLLVGDQGSSSLRRIDASAAVTTLAGQGAKPGTADGPIATARFRQLTGILFDPAGNLVLTDSGACTVRRVDSTGQVTTLAGQADDCSFADGPLAAARFREPLGMTRDTAGNLYVADPGNNAIRRITTDGNVSTFAGQPGNSGTDDGPVATATLGAPVMMVFDSAGNLYFTDNSACTVRRITPDGMVSTLAGQTGDCGHQDGVGAGARLSRPIGIEIDPAGNLYVAEIESHVIRRITPAGEVTTVAGAPGVAGAVDGIGAAARLNMPVGITRSPTGDLYITELGFGATLRKLSPDGRVSTVAGVADGRYGIRIGALPGHFAGPRLTALDPAGRIYVTDGASVLRVTPR